MSKIVLTQVPTFLLRGVSFLEVLGNYRMGKYAAYFPETNDNIDIVITPAVKIETKQVSTDQTSGIYTTRNKSNGIETVATTGVEAYISYLSSDSGKPVQGGKCMNCRRSFSHVSIGIPISVDRKGKEWFVTTFGVTCSYECSLSAWRKRYGTKGTRDHRYFDGEQLLKLLYSKAYPNGGVLREADDPDLLICNGGSLDEEQYNRSLHGWMPIAGFISVPAKMQYLSLPKS